jgi:hypothetical protein
MLPIPMAVPIQVKWAKNRFTPYLVLDSTVTDLPAARDDEGNAYSAAVRYWCASLVCAKCNGLFHAEYITIEELPFADFERLLYELNSDACIRTRPLARG